MTTLGVHPKAIHGYLLAAPYNVMQDRLIFAVSCRKTRVNPELTPHPGY